MIWFGRLQRSRPRIPFSYTDAYADAFMGATASREDKRIVTGGPLFKKPQHLLPFVSPH